MSPQVFHKIQYTKKADVYSLGLIFFRLLSGIILQRRVPEHNIKKCCMHADYLRIMREEVGVTVSKQAQQILKMCLQYDEKDRCSLQELVSHPYFGDVGLLGSQVMKRSLSTSDIFLECNTGEENEF